MVGFVESPALGFDLPLDVRGTAFQQRVWQVLRKIPAGSTASYTEIARIGSPSAVRAVAQACGANTLAVAIPCHRVVRIDGALSGYRWGSNANVRCSNGRHGHERTGEAIPVDRPGQSMAERVEAIDWKQVSQDLDAQGSAMIERLLSPEECETLASLYPVMSCSAAAS